jgi:hypothetical protein
VDRCSEIAPFETPTFSKKFSELIARATKALPFRNLEPISGKLKLSGKLKH